MNESQPQIMRANVAGCAPHVVRALAVAGVLLAGAVQGQGLGDPTRPPNVMDAGGDVVEAGGPVLQSVMISGTRRSAIIGGQLVGLGQKYGEAKLIRVAEGEVTLAQGNETTVLHLFPGIEKKMIAVAPPPAKAAVVHKKTKARRTDAAR